MKTIALLMLILCCKFSLNYWVMLTPMDRKSITLSLACEFAQRAGGKARAFVIVDPKNWCVEIHAEMIEVGI